MSRCQNLDECKCSVLKCDKCDNDAVMLLKFLDGPFPISYYCKECSPEPISCEDDEDE